MPGALDTVDRVHRVLAALAASEDPDVLWYAEATRLCLRGVPWAGALGLHGGWIDVLRHHQQRTALTAILAALPPSPSCRAAAAVISTDLKRYQATTWRHDSAGGRRPPGQRGHLFDYLTADGPVSERQIRRLLPWAAEGLAMAHVSK